MNIDHFREPPYKCYNCEESDNCTRHECNCCGTCEGNLYFFGEELDFSLCSKCLILIQIRLQKGLVKFEQGQQADIVLEKIKVLRKTITEDERKKVFDRDGWKCVLCGNTKNLQIDHKFPFSKGGSTKTDNLQTLCKSCNCKKQATV